MKRTVIRLAILVALVSTATLPAMAGPPSNAGSPTCSGAPLGDHGSIRVHGEHVIEDYVTDGAPGARGGPAHFTLPPEIGPGASFCLEQAQAKSPSLPPGRQ
jgi:hypothetical protein